MAEEGGYVWLSTEATIVTQGARSGRGQHIVCVHQVVSTTKTKEILADVQKQINIPVSRQRPYSDFDISSSHSENKDHNNNNAMNKFSSEQKEVMNKYYAQESTETDKNGKISPVDTCPRIFDDLSSLPIFELDDAVGMNYEPWLFRDNERRKRTERDIIATERFFPSSTAPIARFAASIPQRNADRSTTTSFSPSSIQRANAVADEKCAHRKQSVADASIAECCTDGLDGGQYFSGSSNPQFERKPELDGFVPGMEAIQNDVNKTCRASVTHSGTDYERKSVFDQYGSGFRQVHGWNRATPYFKETPVVVRYLCEEQSPNGNAKTVVEPVRFFDRGNSTQPASTNISTGSTNTEILPAHRMDSSCAQIFSSHTCCMMSYQLGTCDILEIMQDMNSSAIRKKVCAEIHEKSSFFSVHKFSSYEEFLADLCTGTKILVQKKRCSRAFYPTLASIPTWRPS
uniref:Uncharacterized protein n=1 Tax=Romanomermis culicivorax TaxID=13658 RepID=A0A915IXM6_ROMCU